jgi:type II secretory pathway component PulF
MLEPVMLLVMAMLVMLVVLALLVPVIRSSTAM